MVSGVSGAASYLLKVLSAFVGIPEIASNVNLLRAGGNVRVSWMTPHVTIGAAS